MAYCRYCGTEVRSSDTFCFKCGRSLEIQPINSAPSDTGTETTISTIGAVADAKVKRMDVIIDPIRIIVVCILSFGTYFIYWLYLTWKHYRDYTKTKNYPVWHSMALFAPIYSFFRVHAHIRSYKELMSEVGMTSSLRPGLVVAFFLLSHILAIISMRFSSLLPTVIVLDLVTIGLVVGILVWVQANLNRYWKARKDIIVTNARIGVGEVIFVLIGILAWIDTFLPEGYLDTYY